MVLCVCFSSLLAIYISTFLNLYHRVIFDAFEDILKYEDPKRLYLIDIYLFKISSKICTNIQVESRKNLRYLM